jgi:hypothetical protein
MELSSKEQRLSRIFGITICVTLLLALLNFLLASFIEVNYCGVRSVPRHEFCKIFNGLGEVLLIPLGILSILCSLSILGLMVLRSSSLGKVFIMSLILLTTVPLWIIIQYGNRTFSVPAGFMLNALVILIVATAVYNAFKEEMRKIRVPFFLGVFLFLVVFSVPIPAECQKSLPFGGGDGFDSVGYGYEPCRSIFTKLYWDDQNKENWRVLVFGTTLFREFTDDRPGTVILYD